MEDRRIRNAHVGCSIHPSSTKHNRRHSSVVEQPLCMAKVAGSSPAVGSKPDPEIGGNGRAAAHAPRVKKYPINSIQTRASPGLTAEVLERGFRCFRPVAVHRFGKAGTGVRSSEAAPSISQSSPSIDGVPRLIGAAQRRTIIPAREARRHRRDLKCRRGFIRNLAYDAGSDPVALGVRVSPTTPIARLAER